MLRKASLGGSLRYQVRTVRSGSSAKASPVERHGAAYACTVFYYTGDSRDGIRVKRGAEEKACRRYGTNGKGIEQVGSNWKDTEKINMGRSLIGKITLIRRIVHSHHAIVKVVIESKPELRA